MDYLNHLPACLSVILLLPTGEHTFRFNFSMNLSNFCFVLIVVMLCTMFSCHAASLTDLFGEDSDYDSKLFRDTVVNYKNL